MNEPEFLALLRPLATHPAARGLADDTAVLRDVVLTHDMLVEGVHFLPSDPAGDVAWKLLAVNLSDLAAKGATPTGVLMGYALTGDSAWDAAFVAGLAAALAHFGVPLLGGDTVALSAQAQRVLSLTAIGQSALAPARSGAKPGDTLWVTGIIGRAGLGMGGDPAHLSAYRRPTPRLAEGRALAPHVHAMMDVSDGLLIDAQRMAEASGLAVTIHLDAVPLVGDPLAAVTAGDDYELLFAAPVGFVPAVPATAIGGFEPGEGLRLRRDGVAIALPDRLGWLHAPPGH